METCAVERCGRPAASSDGRRRGPGALIRVGFAGGEQDGGVRAEWGTCGAVSELGFDLG
jgi:hypothetical protein